MRCVSTLDAARGGRAGCGPVAAGALCERGRVRIAGPKAQHPSSDAEPVLPRAARRTSPRQAHLLRTQALLHALAKSAKVCAVLTTTACPGRASRYGGSRSHGSLLSVGEVVNANNQRLPSGGNRHAPTADSCARCAAAHCGAARSARRRTANGRICGRRRAVDAIRLRRTDLHRGRLGRESAVRHLQRRHSRWGRRH